MIEFKSPPDVLAVILTASEVGCGKAASKGLVNSLLKPHLLLKRPQGSLGAIQSL